MAVSLESLGIERLGIEERLTLVEELWDSITVDSSAVPLTKAQRTELDHRIAEHEANPDEVMSGEEAKATLTERLKK
jgi:putative addiction module component (TIGR02574 family)